MNIENITIVETFIQGLALKSTDMMPLADNVLLISPLTPDKIIQGKQQVIDFLNGIFPKFEVVGTKIEKHFTVNNTVCTLWEMTFYPNATLKIFDYLEVKDKKLTVIRPYFDPRPLLDIL
jgi:limonene-1,2-epoxide hydrolase